MPGRVVSARTVSFATAVAPGTRDEVKVVGAGAVSRKIWRSVFVVVKSPIRM